MKLFAPHAILASAVLASALVLACAESATDIPDDGQGNNNGASGTSTDNSSTLPPSNPAGGSTTSSSGGSTSSSGGSTSSSGSTTSSSGSTTSSSGGSSGGSSVPACPWAGDFQKMLEKMSEIQAGAPCDSTCDPATHCCVDLLGGLGSSGGGSTGGLPLDAGTSGSGGLPTGGGGTCVTSN